MATKSNNTLRVIIHVCVYLLFVMSLSAQSSLCTIYTDVEPTADQLTKKTTTQSQTFFTPYISWSTLPDAQDSEDRYASVNLNGNKRSTLATFSRYGHKLPAGAEIKGVKVYVEGNKQGDGFVRDVVVNLSSGVVTSDNKAQQFLGDYFPDTIDGQWIYGGENDLWGVDWTTEMINDENFSLNLQLRNGSAQPVTANIDQVRIEVYYKPLYAICDHECVVFYIDDTPNYTYKWYLPQGFERLSSLTEQYTVNIGVSYADFGMHEICVESYDQNGNLAEYCCRDFTFGNCDPSTIGDQIFLDNDNDNNFSIGDEGIPNVTVYLFDDFDNLIATTISDDNGNYSFTVDNADNYYVKIDIPNGLLPIQANVGNDDIDSDLTGAFGEGTTDLFFVDNGQEIDNIDFGLATELNIGDFVWEDLNYNGTQDADEPGIQGVSVQLLDINNDLVLSTTTDDTGFYNFSGIRVDNYSLSFITPQEYIPTLRDVGSEDLDSDINEDGNVEVLDFTIIDMPNFDLDAGYYRYAALGDYVFFDTNENGIQDSGDSALDSIQVLLYSLDGQLIDQLESGPSGIYLFDSLVPGQYIINTISDIIYKPTFYQQGNDPTVDSDLINTNSIGQTDTITLQSNEQNLTIDLGFRDNTSDLGGIVFEDSKYDGILDTQDSLLAGINVVLYDESGEIIQATTTNDDGRYRFNSIYPGNYYIEFNPASDYYYTIPNVGSDDSDSDVTGSNGIGTTDAIVITAGMEDLNYHAGLYRTGSIGDYVFLDLDEDGLQGVSESGLSGITLTLVNGIGAEVSTVVTDESGYYTFDNLLPDTYTVNIISPNLYLVTQYQEGDDMTIDSDIIETNGVLRSEEIMICSGQETIDLDFGFVHNYAEVSGVVFEDSKADGNFDSADTTIANVIVTLYDASGDISQTTTTATDGSYIFTDILTGEYYIVYGLADTYIYTTPHVTGSNGPGSTEVFTLLPGEQKVDEDTGAYIPGLIGDYVFLDLDEDGLQEASESGLSGITLTLVNGLGAEVSTVVTDESGYYTFDNLLPDTYIVNIISPDLYLATQYQEGDDVTIDSDIIETNGALRSEEIMICSGQETIDLDFGFVHNYAEVSGVVFEDSKADGNFDSADTTIANVIVTLYDASGDVSQTTTTASDGSYIFTDILTGEYYIVYGLADTYIYTTPHVTGSNGPGSTEVFTLLPGEQKVDEDTGAYIPGSIGDFVFLDLDEDGLQGALESGLPGITLTLVNGLGAEVSTVVTDESGYYTFDNLLPDTYIVNIISPDLYLATQYQVGDDMTIDSDIIEANGVLRSDDIMICSGQETIDLDFGFVHNYAEVSGVVFEDSKADGNFDSTDTTIASVDVSLIDLQGNVIQTTTTDENGTYLFDIILAGEYLLMFGLSADYIYTSGTNAIGITNPITLLPGQNFVAVEVGAYIPGAISDFVFLDENENGIQDVNENGLGGITVNLLNSDGDLIETIITDASGFYRFENVFPDSYLIDIEATDLYLPTAYQVGNDPSIDSDVISIGGTLTTQDIVICSGQILTDLDFGFINNFARITGLVFEDSKADSLFNDADTTLSNVTISLFDASDNLIQTTTTSSNGIFTFEDILAGEYYLVYGLPLDYVYTAGAITQANGPGSTDIFTFDPGASISAADIGAYIPAAIGDYVFLDLNENGIQDDGDIPLTAIAINLFDLSGVLIDTDTTDANGMYSFENLVPATYNVQLQVSDIYLATDYQEGNDPNLDSDLLFGNGLFGANPLTVCSGQVITNLDFGFVHNYAQINGVVFEDSKADGQLDPADTLIANIEVSLFDDQGNLIQSIFTDEMGAFTFDEVLTGDYYLTYTLDTDYIFSTVNITNSNGAGTTDIFSLSPGQISNVDDTGAYRNGSIGDYIFLDLNEDGIQNEADTSLANIELTLVDANGDIVANTVSDENGSYSFENLTPGIYSIVLAANNLYLSSPYQIGDDISTDSDLLSDNTGFITDQIVICSGQDNVDIDLGFIHNYAQIAGSAFEDLMYDGQFDNFDVGIENIIVTLYNSMGVEQATTTTGSDGSYVFDDLLAGDYYVEFTFSDFLVTIANVGDETTDSDVISGISTEIFSVAPGEINVGNNIGLYQLVSLGDFVFFDENANGLQDASEAGIEGVQINLYNENDLLVASDTSDVNGIYTFLDLVPGMYYIQVIYPEDLTATIYNTLNESLNSDITDANGVGTTNLLALTSGAMNDHIDFGFVLAGAELSGEVWVDLDLDNTQTIGDTLLPNVPVSLYDANDQLIFTTITNDVGAYTFKPLDTGDYYIEFAIPDTFVYVQPNMGDEDVDSDVTYANGVGTTNLISVTTGELYFDNDAGVKDARSSVSGSVFVDKNANGINETEDTLLVPYTVTLFNQDGTPKTSVTSDANGNYRFDKVAPGDYYLVFTLDDAYQFTAADQGMDDSIDSDVTESVEIGSTDIFSVGLQEEIYNDAGVYLFGSIGDYVFFDFDGNGLQDAGDAGISDVMLTLLTVDGTFIQNTNTDSDGLYLFQNVVPGEYSIVLQASANLTATIYQEGGDRDIDSDLLAMSGFLVTDTIMIMSGQSELSIDLGLIENPGQISGLVWNDVNIDGIYNELDAPDGTITVELYDASSATLIATTNTNANGNYAFNNVSSGLYYLDFVVADSVSFTLADAVADESIDSDVTGENGDGTTTTISIAPGQNINNIYAGLIYQGKIGDFVFFDENGNGIQDPTELGIPTIKVILYNEGGVKLDSTITDDFGQYLFSGFDPANYYLEFVYPTDIQPTIYLPDSPTINSDITGTNGDGTTDIFTIASRECNFDMDAGFIPNGASIVGEVWLDTDENDIQDNPNNPVAGIPVRLYDNNDLLIDNTVSNELGIYGFTSIQSGQYYVEFEISDTLAFVNPLVGPDDTDSDVTNANGDGTTNLIMLNDGDLLTNIDAGVLDARASISGIAFIDKNGDGLQVTNQETIDATVNLYNIDGQLVKSTTTNEVGFYIFEGLIEGDYYVEFTDIDASYVFTTPDVGVDDNIDSDVTNTFGLGTTDTLTAEYFEMLTADAGVYEEGSIGDFVFIDENENGIQDSGEIGLENVLVELLDSDLGVVDDFTTTTSGMYLFDDLIPGTYTLRFTRPLFYIPTSANVGGDDEVDSDIIPINDQMSVTGSFDIMSGEINNSYDAGFIFFQEMISSVAGVVWEDTDANGIREAGSTLISGADVSLYMDDGTLVDTKTTGADGSYLFEMLLEGNYYIVIEVPTSMIPTLADIGSEATDSDITSSIVTNSTDIFFLNTGEEKVNLDGGFVTPVTIGDRVFGDNNANGIFDTGEPGIPNVEVNLFTPSNVLVASTTTDDSGFYSFVDVPASSFKLEFVPEDGFIITTPNVGPDDTDSDPLADGFTEVYDLSSGGIVDHIDAGLVQSSTIGDRVFVDINGNGRQGSSEPGLNGVIVRLYTSTGTLVSTTMTNTDLGTMQEGYYSFTDVNFGDYYLEFELPEPYLFTDPYSGSNEELDSDVTDLVLGTTDIFSVGSGVTITGIDAGAYLPAQMGDFAWNDINENGVQDAGEPGIGGLEVRLMRSNGLLIGTTVTDADGLYCFQDLKQGLYFVAFDIPQGMVVTSMNTGGDGAIDSDVDLTGTTPLVSLAHGSSFKQVDAGFISQTNNNLYSQVWFDINENGMREDDEVFIKDVVISLLDDQSNIVAQAETNRAGRYAFTNIAPGDYQIAVGLDDGYEATEQDVGSDDDRDSDVDEFGLSDIFTVNDGLSVPNVDIGLIEGDFFIEESNPQFTESENNEPIVLIQEEKKVEILSGPNPFYNRLFLQIADYTPGISYQILKMDGVVVQSGAITDTQQWIDLQSQTNGLYILAIYRDDMPIEKRYMMKIN